MPMSLSAGDWTRIQKLKNVRKYANEIAINKQTYLFGFIIII